MIQPDNALRGTVSHSTSDAEDGLRLEIRTVSGPEYPQHHVKALPGQISRYCFIPGDHVRGLKIARRLENVRQISSNRAIFVYCGTYKSIPMTVCSTGMGGPQVAIAMEELRRLGADTFIRVGSAGGLIPDTRVGDIAIATAAYRDGGTGFKFLPATFPAVADFHLTRAIEDSARALGARSHLGVVATTDAFYAPPDPDFNRMLAQTGIVCIEMEADTVFILGQYRRLRCGALFVLDVGSDLQGASEDARAGASPDGNQQAGSKGNAKTGKVETPKTVDHAANPEFLAGEDMAVEVALEAMARVAQEDQKAE